MAALWLLIRLNARSTIRRMFGGMKTVKGALLGLFAVGMISLMLLPNVVLAFSGKSTGNSGVFVYGPFMLFAYLLFNLFSSMGERAIYFSPAEVSFLFPAPFSRRQLLLYKMFGVFVTSLFVSIMMTFCMALIFPSLIFGAYGMFMTMLFITLVGMVITLIGQIVAEKAYTKFRRVLGLILLVALAFAMGQAITTMPEITELQPWIREISESSVGRVLLFPFRIFTETMAATNWSGFAMWGAMATAFNAILFTIVISLDANYTELATRVSQQTFDKLKNMQKSGGWVPKAKKSTSSFALPMPSYWSGAGPLVWRQIVGAIRTSRSTMVMGLVVSGALAIPLLLDFGGKIQGEPAILGIVFGSLIYITTLFALNLPMGFRAEADHIEVLKSLPIKATPVAIGQLAGAVLAITVLQWIVIAISMCASRYFTPWWAVGMAAAIPFNVVLFSIANCLFLLYPIRVTPGTKDFQATAKMVLFSIIQMLAVLLCIGLVGGASGLTYWITKNLVISIIPGALILLTLATIGVFLVSWAYEKYDVSAMRLD